MELNIDKIKKQFSYKENLLDGSFKISHTKPVIAKFIPFTTKTQTFIIENILGNFGRDIINKKIKTSDYNQDKIIENMLKNIEEIPSGKEDYIKNFFKEIFFKDENLQLVHPKLLFYLNTSLEKEDPIYKFFKDVFIDDELTQKFEEIYLSNNNELDILKNILLCSFGELETKKREKEFFNGSKFITEKIKEDMLFLLKNETLFVEEFKNLLKFYFFMYMGIMSLEFREQINNNLSDMKGFYFILKSEKASKKRRNYLDGWNRYVKVSEPLLTHRTLLEILNNNSYIESENKPPMTYQEIYDYVNNLDENKKEVYIKSLQKTREWYHNSLEFNARKPDVNFKATTVEENIKFLYEQIEYQFMKKVSTRNKASSDYAKNILEYGKDLYTKKGGSVGLVLSLDEGTIILLTKLAIGDKDEIRLNELYKKFEDRGVYLDRDSREKLREYYEKLNILDKKSDSGDAIYVKHIL